MICVHFWEKDRVRMTGRNIVVFIEDGAKKLKLRHPFLTQEGSTITVKQATIFWKFENVTADNNGFTLVKPGGTSEKKTLQEGYWDFHLLKERLGGEHITLTPDVYDNTCRVKVESSAGGNVNLRKFGKLLGFPESHVLKSGVEERSPNPVDVNCGLRYLEITCDLVDSYRGIGTDGGRNSVFACLPITPGTRLNSSVSEYSGSYPILHTKSAIVTEIAFTVNSNIDIAVGVDILLNIVVESIG